jgi:hypothetical protein
MNNQMQTVPPAGVPFESGLFFTLTLPSPIKGEGSLYYRLSRKRDEGGRVGIVNHRGGG